MPSNLRTLNVVLIGIAVSVTAWAQGVSSTKSQTSRAKNIAPKASEIQQLQDALASQQQQIQQQSQQIGQLQTQVQQLISSLQQASATAQTVQHSADHASTTASAAQQAAGSAQSAATQAASSADDTKAALAVVTKEGQNEDQKVAALQNILGRFRLSGDVRMRGEDSFQDGVPSRNRARIRVRFGLDGKLNEDFIAGFAIATGSLGDPTTTNETFTNFFDRKTIGLDRGYVTYNPVAKNWLFLTGGKFAFPWYRTSLTFDPDVNPEGFDEKVSFDLHGRGLKNFTVQAFQLLTSEVSKGNDSFALGGQVSTQWKLGRLTTIPSFTLIDWRFVDSLLNASAFAGQATTTTGGGQISGEGPGCASGLGLSSVPPCAFAANGFTNATFTGASGKVHFLSGFTYADAILNNQIRTWSERFPLNVVLEYEDNLQAASHPLDSRGNVITSLGPQGKAYLTDISIGQNKNKGDLQFGYSYWRTEQDAIISSWAESDQRAPTNILQNRVYATWKLRNNVSAQYTLWFGRTLNSNLEHAVLGTGVAPGQTEPDLRRQEFDLLYVF